MKFKLFTVLYLFIHAVFVFAIEEVPVEKVYTGSLKHFLLAELSAKDGYKWMVDADHDKSIKVTPKNTVQKEGDEFDVVFTQRGEYTLIFKYAEMRDASQIKKEIVRKFRVVDNVRLIWVDDFERAKKEAAENNKYILLLFTGSDWCGACKELEANVILTKEFQKLVEANFVLYKADFPKRTAISSKMKTQNAKLKNKYLISGYPTTYLLDANGEVKGKIVGYEKDYINEIKKRLNIK